jgi:UDP-glucose 4-epimerase
VSALLDDPRAIDAGSVLVLGSGSIGSAITNALSSNGLSRTRPVIIPWTSRRRAHALRLALGSLPEGTARNAIVWAAGRAGFSASTDACESELAAFQDTAEAVDGLAAQRGTGGISLHLVSSAGGLYEGLTRVSTDSPLSPKRPYGILKEEQERRAHEMAQAIPVWIYRVSSVYGYPQPGHRGGLIAELIKNGVERRPSALYGAMDTLRDYVGEEEVGRHIAASVMKWGPTGGKPEMLVSGRPTSVAQVVDMVEKVLRRRLLVSYEDAWNARDITFDSALKAPDFHPEPLRTGISRLFSIYLSRR